MMEREELLAGLAEECCELGQAALKLRRALTGVNPTPETQESCVEKLEEEIADVMLYLEVIGFSRFRVQEIKAAKWDRWLGRMAYARGNG